MPFIQARARFIHPNTGHTAIDHSPILSVNNAVIEYPSNASVSGYSVRNSPGGANDNYVAPFDNIGANDWIYISFSLLDVKKNDIISWGVPPGDYLNSNGHVDKATIYQLPSQAVVNGTNSIVFNQAASSALVTWRMDEAFQRTIANRQGYIILYINGIEKLRITVFVRGDR